MIKSETLSKLAPALVAAQKKMGAALKDSKNPFFKSKYADLNAIIDAAIPSLNEAGIAVLQNPGILNGKQVIETILLHESGEFIASEMEVTAAKANDPQAAGSATTYARRYGLQAMVTLKAEDDDAEGAMGRKKDYATKADVEAAIVEQARETGAMTHKQFDNLIKEIDSSKPKPAAKVSFSKKVISKEEVSKVKPPEDF